MTFTCSATGPPNPVITWSKLQGSVPASSSVSSEGTLTIQNVRTDDSGSYVCNATNTAGTNSSTVELKVFCSLIYITKPTSFVVLYVGQALKISCPTSSGSEMMILWLYNGTTMLPPGALIETPDTLIIPSLGRDHGGNYSCVSGNSLQFNTSVHVKYPETCSLVKTNICDVSRDYVIDPDGEQGEAPFTVYCNMTDKGGVGVTAVSHNSEDRTHVIGFDPAGSYSRDIQYIGSSLTQIKGLITVSMNCEQFIKYDCKGSMFYSHNSGTLYAWWMSRDGEKMTYWSGASEAAVGCECGMTSSCSDPQKSCNCDNNANTWQEDSGLLTNKSHLPVTQLRFGDTGHSNEEGYHTLGKLKCYEMN